VIEPVGIGISALIAKAAEAGGVDGIVGQDGSAFACGDLLVGIEAKDGKVAEGSGWTGVELCADGFASVLKDEQGVAAGDGLECVHVGGDAEGMDDEDGAGSGGDGSLDGTRREVERDGVDVGEDWRCAHLENRVGYSDEGKGWDDDFVALADAEGEQGQMQARGAGAYGNGVGDGVKLGECGFKGREFGAERQVRRAEDGGDCVDLRLGDVGG